MRRLISTAAAASLLLALSSLPAAAQTTITFRSIVHETLERRASAEACVVDEVAGTATCPGSGVVQGFGQVTSSIVFSMTAPPVRTLTFTDGSTLLLAEDMFISFRTPGSSADAPGAQVGFGNPFFFEISWVAVGGTGTFEGASGSGTQIVQSAGDNTNIKMIGTLTFG
jgi:hypothetical protein